LLGRCVWRVVINGGAVDLPEVEGVVWWVWQRLRRCLGGVVGVLKHNGDAVVRPEVCLG